jgi:septal ring factor EnvC (AmiA/AmiB activator)
VDFVKFMMMVAALIPLNVNAVYKCTTPPVNGSNSSRTTYSSVPCGLNAEYKDLGEVQYRKQEEEAKLAKEKNDREQYRIWKEEESIRNSQTLERLEKKINSIKRIAKRTEAARRADKQEAATQKLFQPYRRYQYGYPY